MPPLSARCSKHSEASAVDVCQRCGSFVCGECVNIRDEDVFCPACVPFLEQRRSKRPLLALALAIAGPIEVTLSIFWVMGVVFAPHRQETKGVVLQLVSLATWVLLSVASGGVLVQEQRARRRGEARRGGILFPLAVAALGLDVAVMFTFAWLTSSF